MARGLFPSRYAVADALTLHGYKGALRRGLYNRDMMASQANQAVALALSDLEPIEPPPFRVYDDEFQREMQRLGEQYNSNTNTVYDQNAPASAPSPAAYGAQRGTNNDGSGSGGWDWQGVLQTLLGPIATGIGGRIAGQNPWAPPTIPPPPTTPPWVPIAIGGAVLLGVVMLARR